MLVDLKPTLKLDFPVYSHLVANSPSCIFSSFVFLSANGSASGSKALINLTRLSFLSGAYEEGDHLCRNSLKMRAYLSAMQTNDCSKMEVAKVLFVFVFDSLISLISDVLVIVLAPSHLITALIFQINLSRRSLSGLNRVIPKAEVAIEEDNFTMHGSLRESRTSQFSLLLKNLNILEESFADSEVLKLERDILLQLERLGALKIFNNCLSRAMKTSHVSELSYISNEKIGEGDCVGELTVSTGKKEERKLRRESASLKRGNKSTFPSLNLETVQKSHQKPKFSFAKEESNSRTRRLIARNEAELAKGIKVAAELEKIRSTLEDKTGQVANLGCWAAAAGLDKTVLQQRLCFGWYCRDELLSSTPSLVLYLTRNYRGLGIAAEDLLQAGNVGVLQGAERFDYTRGYRLSTYVQHWVRKSMAKIVAQHAKGIHTPFIVTQSINKIQKAQKALSNSHGKYADDDKIAKFTGLSLARIESASKCLRVVGSIDQKIGDSFNAKYLEFTPDTSIENPEEVIMRQHMRKGIYNLLKGLDSREEEVLVLRYGLKDHQRKSLEEIGRLFHVSKEWVRRIEKKATTRLRHEETCKSLVYYIR